MADARENVTVAAMTAADIPRVIALAHAVWHRHYPGIITVAQIDYMLAQRYTPARLGEELGRPEIRWEVAWRAGAPIGFSSTVHLPASGELKLDKLYVDADAQGGGVGRRLVDRAAARARELGCRALILAVNKHNEKAIAAYRRYGFSVRESVTVDIGGGFVMDDFIMARPL